MTSKGKAVRPAVEGRRLPRIRLVSASRVGALTTIYDKL
jgi:hypothetical protein